MNLNYPKKKDVYFNNTVYKVSTDDLKHINGTDVVKLPNDLIVYWNDGDQKWKTADHSLIELYTNKKQIDVQLNGNIMKCISNLDLNHDIENKLVTQVFIECVVKYNENENYWELLDKSDTLYKEYLQNINK